MKQNLNLAPIEELLTAIISPKELAKKLDEILFDYMDSIIYLHLHKDDEDDDFIHNQIPDFLFWIRELRDTFWKCEE